MRFARIVMADWSAASGRGPRRETPDRCWVAWCDDDNPAAPDYFRTRRAAERRIADLAADAGGPVLLGFDFPFGCPAGSGLCGGRPFAERLLGMIEDGCDGRNNRFEVADRLNNEINHGGVGPFWGCPPRWETGTLRQKRREGRGRAFAEYRLVDRRLRHRGIQSCWKLYTTGSVGSQMLVGMAGIARIAADPRLAGRFRIWPFETEWDARLDGVIATEIWPSLFDHTSVDHPIKDARQVAAACAWAWKHNGTDELRGAFARPGDLDDADAARVVAEEGWIFAAGLGAS